MSASGLENKIIAGNYQFTSQTKKGVFIMGKFKKTKVVVSVLLIVVMAMSSALSAFAKTYTESARNNTLSTDVFATSKVTVESSYTNLKGSCSVESKNVYIDTRAIYKYVNIIDGSSYKKKIDNRGPVSGASLKQDYGAVQSEGETITTGRKVISYFRTDAYVGTTNVKKNMTCATSATISSF
jgi:hypothetical protein